MPPPRTSFYFIYLFFFNLATLRQWTVRTFKDLPVDLFLRGLRVWTNQETASRPTVQEAGSEAACIDQDGASATQDDFQEDVGLCSSQPITKQRHLKLALHSLNNKILILNEFITDNNLDFLWITETWHKPLDYFSLNQTTPTGYTYMDKPRPEGRGGGVAAIYRKDIKTSTISIPDAHSFKHLTFKVSGPTPLVTAIIYRPSQTKPLLFSLTFLNS